MKREQRLRSSEAFRRVREQAARSSPHPLLVLHVAPNGLEHARVGITVGKRVGTAVVRNRVRRRISAAVRSLYPTLQGGHDLVFVARPASAQATWVDLLQAVEAATRRAGLRRDAATRVTT